MNEACINFLGKDIATKEGKETEVYSRVVGFLTPVQNWNIGKKEEFEQRLEYQQP